jgi:radical SAM protein (TIGR01212 family)
MTREPIMTKDRYRIYSQHLQEKYGERVYKLPVNLPGTCPNRDGTIGKGGCTFCDAQGAGFQCLPSTLSIERQIAENKAFYKKRFSVNKFIVYFQAYTNTYMPLDYFKSCIMAATKDPDLVGIAISTRPDCINEEYLDFLKEVEQTKNLEINIELGLQTVNYHTLGQVNRGHTLAEFIDAMLRIKKRGFATVAHIILNLPGDTMVDVIENAKILSALGVDYVKLHSLYIVTGTVLGRQYEEGKFSMITLEEYIDRVVTFLEYLDPRIVVQRLVGKGPQGDLLFCNWDTSWWIIKESIEEMLEKKDTEQGRMFNYLNGKALKKSW